MDDYQDYYQGELGGFDPRTEEYIRKRAGFNEMDAGDAPTDEALTHLNRLAGGIAHQFNDLLNAINGNCSLALRTLEAGHPVRRYLREIQEAGEKASGYTRELLAYDEKTGLRPRRSEKTPSPSMNRIEPAPHPIQWSR